MLPVAELARVAVRHAPHELLEVEPCVVLVQPAWDPPPRPVAPFSAPFSAPISVPHSGPAVPRESAGSAQKDGEENA